MTAHKTFSGAHADGGKPTFDPGYEETALISCIRSPDMKSMTFMSSAGDKIAAGMSGPPSRNHVREWIGVCICLFFKDFDIDPGIAIRRITQAPGFKIKYDIEMDTAISGKVTKYRIVVEELPDDRMMISIVNNDKGSTEAIIRSDFGNMGDVVWSKVATFSRSDQVANILHPIHRNTKFSPGGMIMR